MPKVSVIIPVYGVEKYIERCARSLFGQTLDDIEYLFIDDCSPDKSVEILEHILLEYPQRRDKVIIHRMEHNSGQAKVREWGMRNATGDYVIHCDSDDWVDVCMYEDMYNKAKEEHADLVVCDFCRTDTKHFRKVETGSHTSDIQEFICNCLFQKDHWSLCNKIFDRNLFHDIVFPTGALGEDMVICIQLLNKCNNMVHIPKIYYYYYVNPMSITKKVTIANCYNNYNTLKSNTNFMVDYINNSLILERHIKKEVTSYLRMVNSFSLLKIRYLPEYKKIWKEQFEWMPLRFFINPKIPLYNKVIYLLSFFPFYPFKKNRATF